MPGFLGLAVFRDVLLPVALLLGSAGDGPLSLHPDPSRSAVVAEHVRFEAVCPDRASYGSRLECHVYIVNVGRETVYVPKNILGMPLAFVSNAVYTEAGVRLPDQFVRSLGPPPDADQDPWLALPPGAIWGTRDTLRTGTVFVDRGRYLLEYQWRSRIRAGETEGVVALSARVAIELD
ncbi:MAG: hypothetical protein ACXIUZ_12160 [Lysobacteraceae bacterium]